MEKRNRKPEYITLSDIYKRVTDSASQPHFIALYQRAAQQHGFVGVPLDDKLTVANREVPDELIRSSSQLQRWIEDLPINLKLLRLEAGEDVTFSREEAMKHFNDIARLKQRGAGRTTPKKGGVTPSKAAPNADRPAGHPASSASTSTAGAAAE